MDVFVFVFVLTTGYLEGVGEVSPRRQGSSPGNDVILRCSRPSGDESSRVEWFRGESGPIRTGDGFEISGSGGEQLRIISADVSDSGVYTCVVTTRDGEVRGSGVVIVGKERKERERRE